MDGTAVAERPSADLSDLRLSPEEQAEEVAERERAAGGTPGAVEAARQKALAEAQAELEEEDGGSPVERQSKAQEVRENAGEPVGEMPPREPEDTSVPPETLAVAGTAQGSRRKWNGKSPTETWLVVKATKIEVPEGEFKKGEVLRFSGEMVVVSEGAVDKLDKDTKTAVECAQVHTAVVLDFELTDE